MEEKREISLKVYAGYSFLPVVTSFIENASLSFGMGKTDALGLTLASEELFTYLCKVTPGELPVEISCFNGIYYVKALFKVLPEEFNFRAFNLAYRISPDKDIDAGEMELFMASHSVDTFHIKEDKRSNKLNITLIKEKKYPPGDPLTFCDKKTFSTFFIKTPEEEEIKLFARLAIKYYSNHFLSDVFKFPGKLVDMVLSKEYDISLAFASERDILGGLVWCQKGSSLIECFGPYIFYPEAREKTVRELLKNCLESVGRSINPGIILYSSEGNLIKEDFEYLATINLIDREEGQTSIDTYFRQLKEDPGCSVWCHPELVKFLEKEYSRLFLPREISFTEDMGERKNKYSLLGSRLVNNGDTAYLYPEYSGSDIQENLFKHITMFSEKAVKNIFFYMDLSQSWQSDFAEPLFANNFKPFMLIPYGGKGDLLVFRWEAEL